MTAVSREKLNFQLIDFGTEGTVAAKDYRDATTWRLTWHDGKLSKLERVSEAAELWFAPGLFDLQVNGYAGVDFQRSCEAAQIQKAAAALRRDGCARTLLTLITCPWDELLDKIRKLRGIVQADAELKRAFPGWHIEGPFLSDQPGYSGAHNPRWMRDPSPADIIQLKELVEDDPLLLTLAPERPGSLETIAQAVACGFVVSFGHSDAGNLREAAAAGGKAFTHLGNGCPQKLDRHDNILWRVLEEQSLIAGIIPDGVHVSPSLFRLLHKTLGHSRVYWTTDAMAAAGAPSGLYSLGELVLEVGDDRVVRNPATGTFAGSALEPIAGIRRGAEMLGVSWREVWDYFSVHPARLMNLPGEVKPGSPAGFCLLREERT